MHFVVIFVGCALFSTAFTLTCYECIPGADLSCVDTQKTCPNFTQCAAQRVTIYGGGLKVFDVTVKDCGAAESLTGSLNFGIFRTFLNGNFCTTDLCNSQTVPESNSSSATPNGKQCFTCKGQDCFNPVNCLGDENSCVSMIADISDRKSFLKGCASKSVCGSIPALLIQLPFISFTLDCCEGNLCNDERSLDTQASSEFLLSSKENKPMTRKQEL